MKKILTFGLLIALLAGIYGYFQWNKPHKDTSKISADVVLDANDLLHAFESDESKANTQYLDKVIKVNGIIKQVENNESGKITLILATDGEMSSITCNFEPPAAKGLTQLRQGQQISIKGLCSGALMDDLMGNTVVLDRCSLAQK